MGDWENGKMGNVALIAYFADLQPGKLDNWIDGVMGKGQALQKSLYVFIRVIGGLFASASNHPYPRYSGLYFDLSISACGSRNAMRSWSVAFGCRAM